MLREEETPVVVQCTYLHPHATSFSGLVYSGERKGMNAMKEALEVSVGDLHEWRTLNLCCLDVKSLLRTLQGTHPRRVSHGHNWGP